MFKEFYDLYYSTFASLLWQQNFVKCLRQMLLLLLWFIKDLYQCVEKIFCWHDHIEASSWKEQNLPGTMTFSFISDRKKWTQLFDMFDRCFSRSIYVRHKFNLIINVTKVKLKKLNVVSINCSKNSYCTVLRIESWL